MSADAPAGLERAFVRRDNTSGTRAGECGVKPDRPTNHIRRRFPLSRARHRPVDVGFAVQIDRAVNFRASAMLRPIAPSFVNPAIDDHQNFAAHLFFLQALSGDLLAVKLHKAVPAFFFSPLPAPDPAAHFSFKAFHRPNFWKQLTHDRGAPLSGSRLRIWKSSSVSPGKPTIKVERRSVPADFAPLLNARQLAVNGTGTFFSSV